MREDKAYNGYKNLLLSKVIQELRINQIRRKREKVITAIIHERQDQLLMHRVVMMWNDRYQQKLQKRTLYWQIEEDFKAKRKSQVISTLRMYSMYLKEQRIEQLLAR